MSEEPRPIESPTEPAEIPSQLGYVGGQAEAQQTPNQPADLTGSIEALLMQTAEPLDELLIAEVVQAPVQAVVVALAELADFYDRTGRGFELRKVAGGWRYWSRPEYAEVVRALAISGQQSKLSQAALETLAVVAYLQPISRQRIAAIRGVNVDSVVRTLIARGMIEESGADEQTSAQMFSTTTLFLEKMGLDSLNDLPALAPLLPDATAVDAELTRSAGVFDKNSDDQPEREPATYDQR